MTMTLNLLGTNMTDRAWIRRWTILAAGLATLAGTATAIAQPDAPPSPPAHNDGFDKPLNAQDRRVGEQDAGAWGGRGGRSTSQVTINDNGRSYHVRVVNGEIERVEVDGKRVASDRYRYEGGALEILDEDGRVEKKIELTANNVEGILDRGARVEEMRRKAERIQRDAEQRARDMARHERELTDRLRGVAPEVAQVERPKVMIGVTLTDASDDDENATGVRVDSVIEDLPAAKAGMREGDIIVKLNNAEVLDGNAFRGKLKTFKPGDKIDVTVQRDGQERILTLELDAYDGEKLGTTMVWGLNPGQLQELERLGPNWQHNWPENFEKGFGQNMEGFGRSFSILGDAEGVRESLEAARESVEEALKSLEAEVGALAQEARADAAKGLKSALESIAKAEEKLGGEGNVWTRDGNGRVLVLPRVPITPRAPRAPRSPFEGEQDETAEQLRLLREQLQRMEERMKEVEKR
jgi:hypothetical protein